MSTQGLADILQQLQDGTLSLQEAVAEVAALQNARSAVTENAHIDLDRTRRCGFPEVVFCEGKTPEAIVEIFSALQTNGDSCFGTRVSAQQADVLLREFPNVEYNPVAGTIVVPAAETRTDATTAYGKVAVITAGTSDRPVAEEAVETLRWMGCPCELIVDVGVAGPHRLQEHRERYEGAAAVVVVAGMEGALPSVVGGWVDCPVIAVPTSVGYGASFRGVAALLGMLNSCAANVTVVNIDAGFKGGYIAGLIARRNH